MKLFCKHEWEVLSEIVTKSKMAHLSELIRRAPNEFDNAMLERKHIQIVTCKKCGAIKRYVEDL